MSVNILSNIRIKNAIILAFAGIFVYVIVNLVGVSNVGVLGIFNSVIPVVTAASATILTGYYWSKLNKADPIERVWRTMGIGLGLWTAAEITWLVMTLISGEIPYPSIADGLWVTGYIFVFLPYIFLYRLLQIDPPGGRIAGIFGFTITYVFVVSIFVISPIIQSPDSTWLDKALGAIYPIGDLLVAGGASLLALALLGGTFSWVWTFISAGFLFQTFSDTLFTYADWNGLYLPGGALNGLTIIIDTTYILGYILVAIGIYTQIEFSRQDVEEPLVDRYRFLLDEQDESLKPVRITLFTNSENKIISASPSVVYLQSPKNAPQDRIEMPYYQALGMDLESARILLQEMLDNGKLPPRSVSLRLADNTITRAKISGIANFNPAGIYIGSDIIVSLRLKEELLDKEIGTGILVEPAAISESRSAEEKLVSVFFVEKLHIFYVIVFRFGGTHASKSLERIFNSNAIRLNAAVQMDGPAIIFESNSHNLPAYRELLKSVINYVVAIASLDVVNREVEKAESRLDTETIEAGKYAGMYGLKFESQLPDFP